MREKSNQPTYKRQRFLLEFIRQIKDDVTSTDLQKLVFLNIMKQNLCLYEFIPYKFGPYSFQLAEDVDILFRDKYLSLENAKGSRRIKAIGEYQKKNSFQIATERGSNLIRKAYREYPYYTINSTITGRLFCGKELEIFNNEKKKYNLTDQVLFTVGYEGRSIEAYINTLIKNNIRLLCDVRKNPLSRKFGFSKNKLKHILETVGIKYIHIPEFGIESDKRSSLKTVEDYQLLFHGYAKTLSTLKPQLENLYSMLCSNDRIALMCFERDANLCHRHVIREYMDNIYKIRSEDI